MQRGRQVLLLLLLLCMLGCRHIKLLPKTVPAQHKYPSLLLQASPCTVWVRVHKLVAWMTQGPSDTWWQQYKEQQHQHLHQHQQKKERLVVCHSDEVLDSSSSSNLQYNINSNLTQLLPKPSICLSKRCVNPRHLLYGTQAGNARSGSFHRTQLNKLCKQFAGANRCDPPCPYCKQMDSRLEELKQQQLQQQLLLQQQKMVSQARAFLRGLAGKAQQQ